MDGKAGAAAGSVDDLIIDSRIHHFHTHINDIARCKILAFFALLRLAHQVFKGIVHNIKVVIKEFNIL